MKKIKPRQLKSNEIGFIREQILKKQKGICPICKNQITDPCLDHHHKKRIKGTGLVRGVLCRNCNSFLGKAENNARRCGIQNKDLPFILRNMADFLEKKSYPYIHPSEKLKEKKLSKQNFNKLKKIVKLNYPNRKPIEYPKSGKLTKKIKSYYEEFEIEPKFLKGK